MLKANRTAFLLSLPALILLSVLLLYPIVRGIILSFTNAELLMPLSSVRFIGSNNYVRMLSQPAFVRSLQVTVRYTVWVVLSSYLIGLGISLLLNAAFRGRTIARLLCFLPWVVPEVVTVMVWRWMFDYQYGVVNFLLRFPGITEANLGWLTQPDLAFISVVVVTVWKQFPLAAIMMLAGLQAIPGQLYEAARIDGANRFQEFQHVTLPGLRPVSRVLIILLTLYSFKRVSLIQLLTGGGPAGATETLSIQTYLQAFKFFRLGYGSAVGTSMFFIMLIFTISYLAVLTKGGDTT